MSSESRQHETGATVTALTTRALAFGYPGRPLILDGIDLQLSPGERVGLIGPNGAGKTTFFLLLSGILKPIRGSITLFGKPVRPGEFNPAIGMLFQHSADQLFCPSVREDLAFGPRNMGLSRDEIERRLAEVAAATGIGHLLDHPPHELSGGEQRLVALAGILAMQPRFLILDEPTSDLDLRYRRRLIYLLRENESRTIFIASHDLEFILESCERVLILEGGRLQADGAPAELMANKRLMENNGLEVPHSLADGWHRHAGRNPKS